VRLLEQLLVMLLVLVLELLPLWHR